MTTAVGSTTTTPVTSTTTTPTTSTSTTGSSTTGANSALGTVSSLGVGSGLDLQSMLDQLRAADEAASITPLQNQVAGYKAQLNEFSVVQNKLYDLKNAALDLSLSTTFLGRTVTSSDQSVLTATAEAGATVQNTTVSVSSLATKSSWVSATGASSVDTSVYVPTEVQSSTGVSDPANDVIASTDGTLDISFAGNTASPTTISVAVGPTAGVTTMNQLVDAINNSTDNVGSGANGRAVTASTYTAGGSTYLQIQTDTSGGTGEDNRVAITNNDTNLALSAPDMAFSYTMGDTTTSVDVPADTSLSGLVDLINNDTSNPGVTASLIDNGQTDPYQLMLQANSTGEDNRITMDTQLPDVTLSQQSDQSTIGSLNANFTVDGISYQRQSNSFSDVIPSVTVNLQGAGDSTVSVASDDSGLQDKITSLVTAYNDVVQEIDSQSTYDTTNNTFGPLANTTLQDLPYDLENIMTQTGAADSSGQVKSMFDLGMQFNQDGTITIDSSTLSQALANDPSGVQSLFLGDSDKGITGLADSLTNRLTTLLADNGQVAAESNAAQAMIDDTNQQIDAQTALLNKKYALMTTQFVQLDQFMSQMTNESSYLTSQFNSLSSGWVTNSSSSSSSG